MEQELRRTNLYSEHIALGGRMVPFAGWELPVQYEGYGPTVEHIAVRNAAGLFDIDHMGQLRVAGRDAEAFLNFVQTVDARKIPVRGAHYGLLPYENGGLVDDIFLYHLEDCWWVVVNASNREKDLAWMLDHAEGFQVTIKDISDETYMLAVQGPKSREILQKLTDFQLDRIPFHRCMWITLAGSRMLIGATGYTGEYGYELYFPAEQALEIWRAILSAGKPEGMLPCGLAARDSLRFEPCLPLYGHELGPDIDPISAGLGFFVDFDKGDFIGREALLKIKAEGPRKKLIGFEMIDAAVPREHYPIAVNGVEVGEVTTGMKSPTLGKFLGLAYAPAEYARVGTEIEIIVRDKPKKAVVARRPFYTPAYRRG